ncbi:MAG TPA: PPC domain-containing DNA-binding protein [Actinomycetota bacterium]|nr:PPC domain-containing DNA-binding protein [Actinomycetota bacterium]
MRFERGEEVMGELASFAAANRIEGAELSGIGAFERAIVGFYNLERQEYDRIPVGDETEVLSLLGNLSITDEGPRVHLHATLSRRDGSAVGGHLFEGVVGATVELFVRETPSPLRRVPDPAAGIPLLDL